MIVIYVIVEMVKRGEEKTFSKISFVFNIFVYLTSICKKRPKFVAFTSPFQIESLSNALIKTKMPLLG